MERLWTDNERPQLLLSSADAAGPMAISGGPERDRLCNVAEMISTFFCFLPPPIWFMEVTARGRQQ